MAGKANKTILKPIQRNKQTLTDKQQRFVEEYLLDLNATKAAIRAGYSKKSARQQGAENLSKPVIQAAIQQAMDERSLRTEIKADQVIEELARIGFSDITHYIKTGPKGKLIFRNLNELPGELMRCVAELSETQNKYGDARRIKMYDKLRALEMLAKHLKLLGGDEEVQAQRTQEELRQSLRYLMEHGYKPPNPVVKMPDR